MIRDLLDCLPEARRRFHDEGFLLPGIFLREVERVRPREEWERNYEGYLDEVSAEYAALAYPWQPSIRHTLASADRSPYLDRLALREDASAFSLDPNFNAFVKSGLDTDIEMLKLLRDQKVREQNAMSGYDAVCHDSKSLLACIARIAAVYDFHAEASSVAHSNRVDFVSRDRADPLSRLVIVDLMGLKKRGNVFVQYIFAKLPNRPFGLRMFVAGGEAYCLFNKNDASVRFAFFAQCRFAAILNSLMKDAFA